MSFHTTYTTGRILAALIAVSLSGTVLPPQVSFAQEQAPQQAGSTEAAPEPLDADEMEVLVARIALYPDELVAVISAASLYPLQIVEAARYLDAYAKDKSLKPKDSWDGSVISLLNYPEIVRMMSDDLTWTQALAEALAYQQKDVLVAIQQLREEAVAKGIIKSDQKVTVQTTNDNIVIQSANPETIYVPQYAPEMLYEPNYAPAPISYYPDPYPNYWYPTAPFFAAAVTGVVWAAAVDWDDWGVWGGHWNGRDVDINCNHCLNNINGRVNMGDIDWKNVDRSKLNFDKNQFANVDRSKIKSDIKLNRQNQIKNRASEINRASGKIGNRPINNNGAGADIRKSTLEGLKGKNPGQAAVRPDRKPDLKKPSGDRLAARPGGGNAGRPDIKRPANIDRPVGKPRPAAKIDSRPRKPSALGNVDRGKVAKVQSNRGQKAMRGGGGGGRHAVKRPAGRRR